MTPERRGGIRPSTLPRIGALALVFALALAVASFWRPAWGLIYYVPKLNGAFAKMHADPLLIEALREQNEQLASKSQEWAADQDRLWRIERLCGGGSLQRAVMSKPSSRHLREFVDASGGLISHALLIDEKGRVAAEPYPSYNFDQARKPKFYYTFRRGAGARDISWIERSADGSHPVCWRAETMVDPASGRPIGTLALEVNYDMAGSFGCAEQPVHTEQERATNRVESGISDGAF